MYDQSKLSELIRFARVDAGSTVIDVYPGDGDWTRLFSDIVGPEGRVYSFVPAEVAHFKNDPVGRMRTLAKEPGRENVEAVSADLVAMPEATQPADVLWLHLFYHDLHTALIQARGATAADFNRAVYERLKPGGSYVIVDHAAAVGAGTSDAQSLHRIEPASVREEVEAAGFVLDAESTMLANKDDPHSDQGVRSLDQGRDRSLRLSVREALTLTRPSLLRLEREQRVELTRSASSQRTAAVCANETPQVSKPQTPWVEAGPNDRVLGARARWRYSCSTSRLPRSWR